MTTELRDLLASAAARQHVPRPRRARHGRRPLDVVRDASPWSGRSRQSTALVAGAVVVRAAAADRRRTATAGRRVPSG